MSLAIVLASLCSCSSDEPGGGSSNRTLKLSKLDIVGAQRLAILGDEINSRAATDPGMLYKMDAQGNLSAVKVEVITLENGETKSVSTDYSVQPDCIFPIGDRYVYLYNCTFADGNGNQINIAEYYEESGAAWPWEEPSILVNKFTGKIYYVPAAGRKYFPTRASIFNGDMNFYNNDVVVANDGTFYMNSTKGAVKVKISGDNATISSFGPQSTGDYDATWSGGGLIPLSNGAVIHIKDDNSGDMTGHQFIDVLYQNGGFETFDGSNAGWRAGTSDVKDEYTCIYHEGKIFAVKRPASNFTYKWALNDRGYQYQKYDSEEVELSLVEIKVGASYSNITIGEPFFTLQGSNPVWLDYERPLATDWTESAREMGGTNFLYIVGDYYMYGNVLAINRNTHSYTDLVAEGISEHVIIPDRNNVYNGKTWYVDSAGADWFNPADLSYGHVSWPYPQHIDSSDIDIKNGKVTINFLNPADGSRTMRVVNFETGEYTDSPVNTDQKIIQLVPMN